VASSGVRRREVEARGWGLARLTRRGGAVRGAALPGEALIWRRDAVKEWVGRAIRVEADAAAKGMGAHGMSRTGEEWPQVE
jgi:hypothetical protein